MLARCTHALTAAGGGAVAPLTEATRDKVLQWVDTAGRRQALRCLALASRTMPTDHRQVWARSSLPVFGCILNGHQMGWMLATRRRQNPSKLHHIKCFSQRDDYI